MEKPKTSKTIQKVIAADGEGQHQPLDDVPVPEMDTPVIDLSLVFSPTKDGKEEISKLHLALSTWGAVRVKDHGITETLIDKIHELTKQFFALPTEVKHKYARENGSVQGYSNDMVLSDDQVIDWTDRLQLITHPQYLRQLKLWPEIPIGFRESLQEYTMKQEVVVEKLIKAMAISLDLEENSFLEIFGDNAIMNMKFNLYPPCPRPSKVAGVKPHTDGSALALILPDKNVKGLQFMKDGRWYKAPMVPDTILINVGDQIEIMSNGIYKSPVHRVVSNREKERISVVTFCSPGLGKEIQPMSELVCEARPRMYKTIKNYQELFFEYYRQGRSAIEGALI